MTSKAGLIVVTSGCQSAAVSAALAGMLPKHQVEPAVPGAGDEPAFREILAATKTWVTSLSDPERKRLLAGADEPPVVITIPNIYFHGFHPDIAHLRAPDGRPLGSAAGEYSSAIVTAGWKLGLDPEQIGRCFRGEIYDRLGYSAAWGAGVEILKHRFDESDVEFAPWYLSLVRREVFMLTDNHPTVRALVELARPVAARLDADPDLVAFPWESVIPDGLLATSTVWPVYPELIAARGNAGGYVWRSADGALLHLDEFVARTVSGYRDLDPDSVDDPRFAGAILDVVLAGGLDLELVG